MSAGLEVADVLHRHGEAYRRAHDAHLGRVERRVMSAIELCRTAAPWHLGQWRLRQLL
jgi:hypothetical protein